MIFFALFYVYIVNLYLQHCAAKLRIENNDLTMQYVAIRSDAIKQVGIE